MANIVSGLHSNELVENKVTTVEQQVSTVENKTTTLQQQVNSLDTKYAKLEHNHNDLKYETRELVFYECKNIQGNDNTQFFKNALKEICRVFPNQQSFTLILKGGPSIDGTSIVSIHNTSSLNSEGLPMFSSVNFFSVGANRKIVRCGTYSGAWEIREI